MNRSQVVATQLQRRDPVAWTTLLRECLGVEDIVVTAVSSESLHSGSEQNEPAGYNVEDVIVNSVYIQTKQYRSPKSTLTRYLLALENHRDPISIIGKETNAREISFYTHLNKQFPNLAPRCWFIHPAQENKKGWILLDEVPNNITPDKWAINDVDDVIDKMAELHATFWQQDETFTAAKLDTVFHNKTYTKAQLKIQLDLFFEEGPGAILSDHAIAASGNLAPYLLKAANGLAVMRALGGWPGILSETHLALAADLLDDPLPMLEPLRRLPSTLLHGSPHAYHWIVTLFDDIRLLDWKQTIVGPGIYDLVNFLEQFDVLYEDNNRTRTHIRKEWPITEETVIDNYMLGMSRRLGSQFNGRMHRNAIPAARCLYTLTNWFTFFADWADAMPNKYEWQKLNRLSEEEVAGTIYEPFIAYRPYLSGVFSRFLRAYRSL